MSGDGFGDEGPLWRKNHVAVPERVVERLEVDVLEADFLLQLAAGRLLQRFLVEDEAAGEGPLALEGRDATL